MAIIPIVAFVLLVLPLFVAVEGPGPDVVVDGSFEDWSKVTKIPSTRDITIPNRNIDIVNVAARENHRFLSLYVEVDAIALWGNPSTRVPDTFNVLLDVDNDDSTGYLIRGMGADYLIQILGYRGEVNRAQLYKYVSESDQRNWSAWQRKANLRAAADTSMLETQVSMKMFGRESDRIAILFHAHGYDEYYDFSDSLISNQRGVLTVDQLWNDQSRVISGANNEILRLNVRALGRSMQLESLTIHLMGDADPLTEVGRLRLLANGEFVTSIESPASKLETFEFKPIRIDEGQTILLTIDADVGQPTGNTLAARVTSSSDFGLREGIASLQRTIPSGSMNYIGEVPDGVEVDGAFLDWPDPNIDAIGENLTSLNPNIDIVAFASKRVEAPLRTDAYFFINVAGAIAGGSLVPYESPGPIKEYIYFPDSDRDTVPDHLDPFPNDFNNDGIEDQNTNYDVDNDFEQDYPHGPDCRIESTLPISFPPPYGGANVSVYICPTPVPRVTGEDYLNIFVGIDGDAEGFAVGPIFADYLLQIKGKNGIIESTDVEFLEFDGTDSTEWRWKPSGLAVKVESDMRRMEAYADISFLGDRFEVVFQTTDWKKREDFATNLSWGGRSATRGSFGEYDVRYSSGNYESYLTSLADKVSFHRKNSHLSWSLPQQLRWIGGGESRVLGSLIPSYLNIEGNAAVYDDAYSGMDAAIEYLFESRRLKENFILESELKDISSEGELSLVNHLEFSKGLMIYAEGEDRDGWTVVSGGLTFQERDYAVFHISSPYAVDSQGSVLDCYYLYNRKERILDLRCPSSWFLTANYPILIDPPVTTYTLENDGTLGQSSEFFGRSVAIGDFNNDSYADVAAGAPYADIGSNSDAGAVYIYYGPFSGADTSPDVWIVANNSGAYLGWAIAAGKFNNDDIWDIVVTQLGNDAYAYYGSENWAGWETTPDATFDLSAFQETGTENFGNAVAVGNINYDGTPLNFDDVVFGANLSDIPGDGPNNDDGMGYIFISVFASTETSYDAVIYPAEDSNDGEFATSIACGKIDNDDKYDIVVGEPKVNTSNGMVHIFYGDNIGTTGGSYYTDAYLEVESTGEMFGFSVAVGAMDSDSYEDILVGAPKNSEYGGTYRGRAYVYQANTDGSGITDSAAPDRDLAGPDEADGAEFGYSVAVGDFEGDGVGDAIVGAPFNTSGGTNRGSVMIFDDPITSNNVTDYFIDGEQNNEYLGWSVVAGEFSNDASLVIAAGAPNWDDSSPSETDAGRVMVILIPEHPNMILIAPILLAISIAALRRRKSLKFRGLGT
ncbi:MAG: hypothetical protein ACE5KV_01665 [Thermoplasmata archaeon]